MNDSDTEFDFLLDDEETIAKQTIMPTSNKKIINYDEEIKEFLKNTKFKYKVIGGKSVDAWLDTKNSNLSLKEKEYLQTDDWDITIKGTNSDAKDFTESLYRYLVKNHGEYFEKMLEDTIVTNNKNEYIYRLGIIDSKYINWIVDVHAEPPERYNSKSTIKIDGVVYHNLKSIIEDIEYVVFGCNVKDKMCKRLTRKKLVEDALKEIKRLNIVLFERICKDCTLYEKEQLTGYELNCKQILKICK